MTVDGGMFLIPGSSIQGGWVGGGGRGFILHTILEAPLFIFIHIYIYVFIYIYVYIKFFIYHFHIHLQEMTSLDS